MDACIFYSILLCAGLFFLFLVDIPRWFQWESSTAETSRDQQGAMQRPFILELGKKNTEYFTLLL